MKARLAPSVEGLRGYGAGLAALLGEVPGMKRPEAGK